MIVNILPSLDKNVHVDDPRKPGHDTLNLSVSCVYYPLSVWLGGTRSSFFFEIIKMLLYNQ